MPRSKKLPISFDDAYQIALRELYGYMGQRYSFRNAVEDFCRQQTKRAEGCGKTAEAIFRVKQEMSDPMSRFGKTAGKLRRDNLNLRAEAKLASDLSKSAGAEAKEALSWSHTAADEAADANSENGRKPSM